MEEVNKAVGKSECVMRKKTKVTATVKIYDLRDSVLEGIVRGSSYSICGKVILLLRIFGFDDPDVKWEYLNGYYSKYVKRGHRSFKVSVEFDHDFVVWNDD